MKKTLLVVGALAALNAGAAYKCVDEKGQSHFGDTPPPGCANVEMYEITRGGTVIRTIPPTPTPAQLKEREAEKMRQAEAARAAAEQKRRDTALLQTFSSEKEFEVARDRNIEPLKGRIRVANERIKAIEAREKQIAEALEFYKDGRAGKDKGKAIEPPRGLIEQRTALQEERSELNRIVANAEKEIEGIRERFDTDRKRWVELRRGGGRPIATSAPASK